VEQLSRAATQTGAMRNVRNDKVIDFRSSERLRSERYSESQVAG
jgi:hypothetical protein